MTGKGEGMSEATLLVLAAGIGQRYGGLKQLDPVGPGGETILDYSLYDALLTGFNRAVFVVRRDIEGAFWEGIGNYWKKHLAVDIVFQEIDAALPLSFAAPRDRRKPWGTAHAVLVSGPVIRAPFAVINADDFYGRSAFEAIFTWLQESPRWPDQEEYCFVGYPLAETLSKFGAVSRAVCTLGEGGFLRSIQEMTSIEKRGSSIRARTVDGKWTEMKGDEMVSLNLWGFRPSVFSFLGEHFASFLKNSGTDPAAEFFLPTVMNELVASGKVRVRCLPAGENWFGITYPEDLELARDRVQKLVAGGLYPEKIRK